MPSHRYLHRIAPPPLVRIPPVGPGGGATIFAKLEFLNPSGSTKDRIARHMLEKALRTGALSRGDIVVEASSGSTSIALALAAAQLGLRFLAFIPEAAARERQLLIRGFGGEVRPVAGGMREAIVAAAGHAERFGLFCTRQFENPDNCEAHRLWTAGEILQQLGGRAIDAVVSGVGTGGTLRGLWEGFSGMGCPCQPVAAIPTVPLDPANPECCSLRFSGQVPGVVEGCSSLYAEWKESGVAAEAGLEELEVDEATCLEATRWLWRGGFPVGPSSGLNLEAARRVAARLGADQSVVTVFPDRIERYFSHPVFTGIDAG